jgi:hypothetical protein
LLKAFEIFEFFKMLEKRNTFEKTKLMERLEHLSAQ